MALGSLLLFFALLILVTLIVVRPLVEEPRDEPVMMDRSSHWLAERERVLDALAELDADWKLGKVPAEIYRVQRQQLVAKGTLALKELESSKGKKRKPKTQKGDELEKMISAYKVQHKKHR